ncbi:hypothetical protein DSUL_50221 [Desulfovibrionales bacterium]
MSIKVSECSLDRTVVLTCTGVASLMALSGLSLGHGNGLDCG